MISIVIPCYNNSQTIQRSLSSVLNQTYEFFEISVIDDGSADVETTEAIITELADNRIKLIKHVQNKNGSAARNTGLKNATGEWIAFLDADDEWLPTHLENCLAKVHEIQKNSADLICIYSKSIIKNNRFIDLIMPEIEKKKDERIADYLFCNTGFIQSSSIFISRRVAEQIHWNEQLIRHQDYDFLFQMEKFGVEISMSNHVGCIIHWEDNDIEKKGGTWEYSYNWAIRNKQYFSNDSIKCFILKNCVFPLLSKGKRVVGAKFFLKNCIKIYSLKEVYILISVFLFKKVVFSKI